MAWNPFEKLKKTEKAETGLDAALESWERGDKKEKRYAVREIIRLYRTDPQLFEEKEDQVINILKKYKGEEVGKILNELKEKKEQEIHEDTDKTKEMPVLTEGLIELTKTKQDFEDFAHDVDELMGFMGAVRQLIKNEQYFSDEQYVQRLADTISNIGDAVSTWQNPAEKAELEKKYSRLLRDENLPANVRKKLLREVA